MGKTDVKESIIKQGALLVHSKGYNNTGLSDILNAAGVPKGSFYFYFKSKDDFGLALLDYYWEFIKGMIGVHFTNEGAPPLKRLENFMDAYQRLFTKMGFKGGCPIGNLMQEMSDLNEDFRAKVDDIYSRMKASIARLLQEAYEKGDLADSADLDNMAQFILNSWEGSIMHMKLIKNDEPLKLFKNIVFKHLLNAGSGLES
jgi:TetR/AcrR family transcriptional regulator, transcriptional repressor for nem operon